MGKTSKGSGNIAEHAEGLPYRWR